MNPPVQVIINGAAGRAAHPEGREELARLIAAALSGAEVVFTEKGTDVTGLARQAIERGSPMVVAGGGDGTVNAVASAVIGTNAVFGVLPLGTLNHFAKDVGIPLDLESAIETLASGRIVAVDVGQVNKKIFLNNSSLGLYPAFVRLREARQKRGMGKWPAAVWAALKALSRYRLLTVRIEVNGRELLRKTPIVFVGNNEYDLSAVRIPKREQLTDGMLSLYLPYVQGRVQVLWFAVKVLLTDPRGDGDFDILQATRFTIRSRHTHLKVSLDGEVGDLPTPLEYQIRPRSLRVMVPRAAP